MKRKLKWLFLLLIVVVHKCPRCLAAELFEDQPKILVNDGNLVFESAESKNISIKLKGKSRFLIDNVDVLRLLVHSNSSIHQNSIIPSTVSKDIDELRDQVKRLKSIIRGRDGILKRLERLEDGNPPNNSRNSTTNSTTPNNTDRRRIMGLQRRVVILETRVANLTERLTKDHCKSYPCQNGGTCFNMFDTFRCECPKSWEGPTCSLDVDECSRYLGTEFACQNGASCINKPGTFECICKDPWKGQQCSQQTVDCTRIPHSEICGHGTCVQTSSKLGYTCICEQGWRASNETFSCNVDIDECTEMRPHCSDDPKVQCYNTPGSFICGSCPAGYTGNGYSCVDVNECEINNGGCSISPKVECINSRGSFRCASCPFGYDGDGRVCYARNSSPEYQCADKNLCSAYAQCIQLPLVGPSCKCNVGFTGHGFGPNGCVPSELKFCSLTCKNDGICKFNETSLKEYCECPRGTVLPNCEKSDPCASRPCKNNGNCTASISRRRYSCKCLKGFSGLNCQFQVQSKCDSGVKTGENGTISVPQGGQGLYERNQKCAWVINVNITKVINVTFNKFDLEQSSDCRFDWLQIHDGRTSAAQLIGRFCGKTLPKGGNIISTHNHLYFWFRSDNNTAHEGFDLTWSAVDPVCGGEINATSHGIISSPGSPGKYPINRDCTWVITAPPSKRIQFLFYNLNIETHPTCDYDFVEISSGNEGKTSLGKFCSTTTLPPKLLTPTNVASIHFHSDGDSNDYGFQLTYSIQEGIPGCGGTYTAGKGDITSPVGVTDGKYKHNMVCDYIIQMPTDTRVRLSFEKFKLETSSDCKFDRVEIYDGDVYDEAKLIGRYCGEKTPPVVTSLTNVMTMRFTSDWSTNDDGFQAKYQLVCGGTFTADNGNISSPNYPNPYNGDRTCEYDIVAPEGRVIILNVLDFDVEKHSVCEFDNLEIFDFPTADNSTSLGKFCGQTKPGIVTSTYNHLHIHFSADASINGRGFFANYSFVDVSCGGIITDASRVIRSPMSTDANGIYQSNANCRWVVVAPVGYVIQMNFINFELELDASCKYDFLKVFNNASGKGEPMGPFCGTNAPKVITTIDNIATIFFHTDSSQGKEGFTISLSFIDGNKLCGANYFSSHGIVKSPNNQGEYLPNKECEWIINVPRGQQIELTFNYFEIEQHMACKFDGLEIRNGGNSLAPLIGKFCGSNIPPPIRSFGNQMYLKFTSDASRNGKGFELEWDGALSGCGGVITSSKGSISSPQHPLQYPHNARCEWRISVNEGSSIEIIFTDLDFETQRECKYDYLEIFDGSDASAPSLGRFCSSENHPMNLVTSNNHAFIRMNTDDSQANRGFYLKYKTQCNRTITGTSGVIESQNFPDQYPDDIDCAWTIVVPKGNNIHTQFSHFELENEGLSNETSGHICKYDHVGIYDLDIESGTKKRNKTYCNHAPEVRNSTTDAVVITFHSDQSSGGIGFRMEWYLIGCGGKLSDRESGTILSPNYPNQYPHNIICLWEIEVDYGYDIEITVNHLDIEGTVDCRYDYLMFATDRNFNQTIAKLCQTVHESGYTYAASGHLIYMKFGTDGNDARVGFNVTYRQVVSSCGGKFVSQSGVISTRNYPKQNYEDNAICEWDIKTDISHSLTLQLLDFDLESSTDCKKDKLEIIDTAFNQTLWSGCGNLKPNETTFKSKRNELLVRLTSDDNINAKGFIANYTQSCGSRIIVTEPGLLKFRRTTNENSCVWRFISKDPTKKIRLTFTRARLLTSDISNCTMQVRVLDGDSITGPERLSFCTSKVPPAIISNGNALTVLFYTVYNIADLGLEASYSVLDNSCGAEYTDTFSGQFSSPFYPNSSPLGTSCVWKIVASSGNKISLSIQSIDIANSPNCNDNYLEIRENDRSGALVGVFCGTQIPSNLKAAQSFWIKYQTDSSTANNGFMAEFTHSKIVELNGKFGTIESPLYPRYDDVSEEMRYRITVAQGSVIRFEFPEFYIENDSDEDDSDEYSECDSYLRFHDGFDSESPTLQEAICSNPPKSLTSSTNVVLIIANLFDKCKYRVTWKEVEKLQNSTSLSSCGDYAISLTNASQVVNVTSPGFPNGYDIGLNCTWTITSALSGYHPVIYFTKLDLEDGSDCFGDYVTVFSDREDGSWKKVSKMCNMDIRGIYKFYQGTPNLRINFHSDYYANKTGFNATAKLACGGVMTGPEGTISVIGRTSLVDLYNGNCMWNITVGRGKRIQFEFTNFTIQNTSSSCSTYLTIRNGIGSSSPYLGNGKYCGSQNPRNIPMTSSNRAFVKLTLGSYSEVRSIMFTLKYSEVQQECGGTIRLTEKNSSRIISTPNYPNIPHPHSECLWTIMAPTGERLKIDFLERFDLKQSRNCSLEFVELKDGATSISPIIGSFCGPSIPRISKTKSNMLNMRFFTDSGEPGNGFKANVSIDICGGMLRSENGIITSPRYPGQGAYPHNSQCDYHITWSANTVFNLTFNDLNLPPKNGSDCDKTKDYLEIFSVIPDSNASDSETLMSEGVFCGDVIPSLPVLTVSGKALFRFMTFEKTTLLYRGFKVSFRATTTNCGGNINAESGIITSPGYPSKSLSVTYCEWRITVAKGNRVAIEFDDLDILPMTRSLNQRISILNDNRIPIVRFTNISNKGPYYSSDNMMMINFLVRTPSLNRGFKLKFSSEESTICRGNLNTAEGEFQVPNQILNETYASFICKFVRDSKPIYDNQHDKGTLAYYFKNIQAGRVFGNCRGAPNGINVIRRSGITDDEKFLGRICGNASNTFTVLSPFSDVTVEAKKSYGFFGNVNFTLSFKTHKCGGKFFGENVNIAKNASSIDSTEKVVDCAWYVKHQQGFNVKANFKKLQLKMSCDNEWIMIYNGPSATSPLLGKYCGDQISSEEIVSDSNSMFITYHTDNFIGEAKDSLFDIEVKSGTAGCGGSLTANTKEFSSPLYDGGKTQYLPNTECIWDITADSNFHVGLVFTDRFFIQSSTNCTNDSVEVFDYKDNEWQSLGKVCGREHPTPFNTTSNKMRVIFRSDDAVNGDGFKAMWAQNCGGTFVADNVKKVLSSPGYPIRYAKNLRCNYTITAPEGKFININFLDFGLEEQRCGFDNLTMYKKQRYTTPPSLEKVGTFCGITNPGKFRMSELVNLKFYSDKWIEKKGWSLEYSVDDCGGLVTESQVITSPEIARKSTDYLGTMSCYWNITAPKDDKIIIRFQKFAIEYSDTCIFDSVDVYNGTDLQDKLRLARICGNLTGTLKPLVINQNHAMIRLKTDQTQNFDGFSAEILFKPKCDLRVTLSIENPVYTVDLTNQTFDDENECTYLFTGAPMDVLKISFASMHLSTCDPDVNNNTCDCDYLDILDGNGPYSPEISRVCGHDVPSDITSSKNALFIRFVTDKIRPSTGFNFTVSRIASACGDLGDLEFLGNETGPVNLTSPSTDGKYLPNMNCLWKLSAPYGKYFDIRFDKFDMQESDNCINDSLTIEDAKMNEFVIEGLGEEFIYRGKSFNVRSPNFYTGVTGPVAPHIYCGSKPPQDYVSSSSKIKIQLKSDATVEKSGISVSIRLLDSCSRNFTAPQGRLVSAQDVPNICKTTITVPKNYTISLFFTRFYMFESDCTKSYLKVYDGSFDEGALISTHCGYVVPNPIFSKGNQLSLIFHYKEDSTIFTKGSYDLMYLATDKGQGCGGEIYNYGGMFTSPMYPSSNRTIYDCTWTISVPKNLKVAIRFSVFDMGSSLTCANDYVEFIEANESNELTSIRKYCGEDIPQIYVSPKSKLQVHYMQTVNFAGTGWQIQFMGVQEGSNPQSW